mgnify:CR=1 FL=1
MLGSTQHQGVVLDGELHGLALGDFAGDEGLGEAGLELALEEAEAAKAEAIASAPHQAEPATSTPEMPQRMTSGAAPASS